jgi:SAM-dependent methyltransferase
MMSPHKGQDETESPIQRRDYLDVSYSEKRKPQTGYPLQLCQRISKRYFQSQSGKLLDVGCGRGDQARAMIQIGFDVTGCDLSPQALKNANNEYPVEVFDFENDEFPWPDQTFDFVYCKSVIEHMHNPDVLLLKCLRVLKPGGKAVFSTPDWENMYQIFYSEYTHRTPFTRKSLLDCLLINGFSDVKVERLTQLPWLWKFPFLKIVTYFLAKLPELFRRFKNVRFSKEIMLISVGTKSIDETLSPE